MKKKIATIIGLIVVSVTNNFLGIIRIPNECKMESFQFDLFTICSVLAGFSFTVMGLLAGILSEELVEKLKNTTLITNKSELILKSIICFGIPSGLSVLFFTGIIDWLCELINLYFIMDFLFVTQVICILVGFFYFFRATRGIYLLIEKIYGVNEIEMKEKKQRFMAQFKKNK